MNVQHFPLDRAVVEALREAKTSDEVRGICRLLLLVEITAGYEDIIHELRAAYRRLNTPENGLGLFVEHSVIVVIEAKRQAGADSSHDPRRFPFDGSEVGHEIRGAIGCFPGRLTGTGSL